MIFPLILSFLIPPILLSSIYGLYIGVRVGAERTLISDYAKPNERDTAFGWYHLTSGFAAIPAGLLSVQFSIFIVLL